MSYGINFPTVEDARKAQIKTHTTQIELDITAFDQLTADIVLSRLRETLTNLGDDVQFSLSSTSKNTIKLDNEPF